MEGRFDATSIEIKVETRVIARIIPYVRPYFGHLLAALFFMVVVTLAGLLTPYLEAVAIDRFILNGEGLSEAERLRGITGLALLYLAINVVTWLCSFAQTLLVSITGQNVIYTLRQKMFVHLQKLSFSFFDKTETGRIMTRLTNDVNALSELISSGILNVVNDALMLAGIVFIMSTLNLRLALLTFATLPLMIFVATRFRGRMQRAYHEVRRKAATVNVNLAESISGVRVTQSFVREDRNARRFDANNMDNMQANMQAAQLNSAFGPVIEILATVGVSIVIWYGGALLQRGEITLGVVFAFLRYVGRFFMPIRDLSQVYNIWQAATVSIDRIFELLDAEPSVKDAPAALDLPPIQGHIKFDNVTFGYEAELPILHNVTLEIPPGRTVALVGPTGAGKSSIINLLARFYDPTSGVISIDGHDLTTVTQRSLHEQVSMVLQDSFIFNGSVRNNIAYGRPDASQDDIIAAAEDVNAHEFIMRLPDGYDTEVGERGARLSQGQRQLLSFARALLCRPSILILDEATSSVDAYTEVLIQRALEKLLAGRTAVVIAHRLSTIRHADTIVVIDQGRIVEQGNHHELMQLVDGLYRRLYERQYGK
ncbi:MAG: ABC transporter ATP-binding protein [Firmicutes bacterium]|nr:ABC transporter ATP-binding protein [Dethiobacter sp.]MBS3888170.1 ABC transporter ATP-binding protein [Bacillota bacterium]